MNCQRVKKLIPLLAGEELSEIRGLGLKQHLQSCVSCQKELKEYQAVLARIKAIAQKEDAKDWEEAEWNALIEKAVSQKMQPKAFPIRLSPKLALAYGLSLLVIIILTGVLLKYIALKPKSISPTPAPTVVKKTEAPKAPPFQPQQKKPQDVKKPEQPLVMAKAQKRESPPVQRAQPGSELAEPKPQEAVSVTLVSNETGLKVVWFFDKNFEWKGEKK